MELNKAMRADVAEIMRILGEARMAQRAMGFTQWGDGYPPESAVVADIENGAGYLLKDDSGATAGYVAISFSDKEYDRLEHIWVEKGRYGVAHRIAIADSHRGKGVATRLFDLFEQQIAAAGRSIVRIDTGVENRPMQHILAKRGYRSLGAYTFVWGERLAYEKSL